MVNTFSATKVLHDQDFECFRNNIFFRNTKNKSFSYPISAESEKKAFIKVGGFFKSYEIVLVFRKTLEDDEIVFSVWCHQSFNDKSQVLLSARALQLYFLRHIS